MFPIQREFSCDVCVSLAHIHHTRCHCRTITLFHSNMVADGEGLLWVNLPVKIEWGSLPEYFIKQPMQLCIG